MSEEMTEEEKIEYRKLVDEMTNEIIPLLPKYPLNVVAAVLENLTFCAYSEMDISRKDLLIHFCDYLDRMEEIREENGKQRI